MDDAKSTATGEHNRMYVFMRSIIRALTRVYFRLETSGIENLPKTGGVMLVSNHLSNLDPTTVACMLPRQVHFLAKEELFKGALGNFLRTVNAFPVSRSGVDRKALHRCIELLKGGNVLLIFPEGQRSLDGTLDEAKPGAALIASQAKCPIVPMAIEGSLEAMPTGAKFIKPAKIRVMLGPPFSLEELGEMPDKKAYYEAAGKLMMARIGELQVKLRELK